VEVAPRRLPPRCRPNLMSVRAGLQLVLQKSFVQVLERAKGRDAPGGGILDVVARQPYLLSRAVEVPRKATNRALVVYAVACLEIVLLGTLEPPSSCDSCRRMSTQARSCRFHFL
jgi:hypothetical protein